MMTFIFNSILKTCCTFTLVTLTSLVAWSSDEMFEPKKTYKRIITFKNTEFSSENLNDYKIKIIRDESDEKDIFMPLPGIDMKYSKSFHKRRKIQSIELYKINNKQGLNSFQPVCGYLMDDTQRKSKHLKFSIVLDTKTFEPVFTCKKKDDLSPKSHANDIYPVMRNTQLRKLKLSQSDDEHLLSKRKLHKKHRRHKSKLPFAVAPVETVMPVHNTSQDQVHINIDKIKESQDPKSLDQASRFERRKSWHQNLPFRKIRKA